MLRQRLHVRRECAVAEKNILSRSHRAHGEISRRGAGSPRGSRKRKSCPRMGANGREWGGNTKTLSALVFIRGDSRHSRGKGGFGADLGRFGETTLPFFRREAVGRRISARESRESTRIKSLNAGDCFPSSFAAIRAIRGPRSFTVGTATGFFSAVDKSLAAFHFGFVLGGFSLESGMGAGSDLGFGAPAEKFLR